MSLTEEFPFHPTYIPTPGGPAIWILQDGNARARDEAVPWMVRQLQSTTTTATTTTTIRRMLVRPVAILLFGFCLLQALDHSRELGYAKGIDTRCSSSLEWEETREENKKQKTQETNERPSTLLLDNEFNPAVVWSSNQLRQQQLPPYPAGGWGRRESYQRLQYNVNGNDDDDTNSSQDAGKSPDNPQLYGWEPNLYPDPIIDPVRCGIAYLEDEDELEGTKNAAEYSSPMRLCDPDWVLGGMYLEQIAAALHNFSAMFGDLVTKTRYWGRQRMLMGSLKPLRRRRRISEQFSIEASSEDSGPRKDKKPGPTVELAVATVRKVRK